MEGTALTLLALALETSKNPSTLRASPQGEKGTKKDFGMGKNAAARRISPRRGAIWG